MRTERLRWNSAGSNGEPDPASRLRSPRRELTAFLGMAVLTLVVVATTTAVISGRLAERNARDDAEDTTQRVGRFLVQPALEEALAGVPGRWAELDSRVQNRLGDGSIVQLLVWNARGEVIYANDAALVGQVFPPTPELLRAIDGEVVSDLDDAPEASAGGDRADALVEVYAPLRAGSEDLALEAYFSADVIAREAAALRGQVLPVAVGALLALQLVQVPIAVSLFRRVRRQDSERAELLARSLTASDRERRALAADLHDGPVQDLAGVSYALSGLRPAIPADRSETVDRVVTAVRDAVHSLRGLIVDLYPPDLSAAALSPALSDLADRLRGAGIDVSVRVGQLPDLDSATAAAVYRTAKESLENVRRHAGATRAWLTLDVEDGDRPVLRLEVADDGSGIPDVERRHADGHLGLRLMRDRVTDMGGRFAIGARDGGGTMVTAEFPTPGGG